MSGNAELLQAMNMFQGAVRQASTASAINDATAQMQQIKSQVTDEAQKRVALQGLSDNLALRLVGAGADASHIQTAFQAIAPQSFGSAEQMQLEGMASGNQHLQNVAGSIIKEREDKQKSLLQFQARLQEEADARKMQREMMVAQMKAGIKGKEQVIPGLVKSDPNVTLSDTEVANLRKGMITLNSAGKAVRSLEELVSESGTEYFNMPGNKTAAAMSTKFQDLIFRLKEAKNLGVLQKIDVEALEKLVPDPTGTISTGTWKAKMQAFKESLANDLATSSAMYGYQIPDETAINLGLGKQLGALPADAPEQVRKIVELAKKYPNDMEAQATLREIMKNIYGAD